MPAEKNKPNKRGPKEDRLNIETDPDDALDKLLGKEPEEPGDDDSEDCASGLGFIKYLVPETKD